MPATRRTLGALRDEIARRLGFHQQGGQAQANRLLIEDFVKAAQSELWWMLDFPELRRVADIPIDNAVDVNGSPQIFWDWPTGCDPRRLHGIRALVTNWWRPLIKGIEESHDSLTATGYRAYPQRWDDGPQLEIWPAPDRAYTVRVEYQALPAPFVADADPCSIDDELVLLHALVAAKTHYRQEDASVYASQLAAMIRRFRAAAHGLNEYDADRPSPPPMPVRV